MTKDRSYDDILNRSWDDVQEVKLVPNGSYMLECRGASIAPPKSGDGDPQAVFAYEVVEPMADVAEEDLAALGPGYELRNNRIFQRFWIGSDADLDRIRQHILKHGVANDDLQGRSIGEGLKVVKGKKVVARIGRRTYTSAGVSRTENEAQAFAEAA